MICFMIHEKNYLKFLNVFTLKKELFYWKCFTGNYSFIILNKKNIFTGQKLHENISDLLEKMTFFTGRFIHSQK
jgi:hypothetical protein